MELSNKQVALIASAASAPDEMPYSEIIARAEAFEKWLDEEGN